MALIRRGWLEFAREWERACNPGVTFELGVPITLLSGRSAKFLDIELWRDAPNRNLLSISLHPHPHFTRLDTSIDSRGCIDSEVLRWINTESGNFVKAYVLKSSDAGEVSEIAELTPEGDADGGNEISIVVAQSDGCSWWLGGQEASGSELNMVNNAVTELDRIFAIARAGGVQTEDVSVVKRLDPPSPPS